MGDKRTNLILAATTTTIAVIVGVMGWAVLTFSRGPNACRAHGGVEISMHSERLAPPGYVICKDGVTVPLDSMTPHP